MKAHPANYLNLKIQSLMHYSTQRGQGTGQTHLLLQQQEATLPPSLLASSALFHHHPPFSFLFFSFELDMCNTGLTSVNYQAIKC